MESSSGRYYIGLDHIRAVAAFLVFTWHFIHVGNGHQAPPPIFPLSFLSEGHTGVSLFLTLSGYLFAKLLDGKDIKFVSFIWNRFLRLAPLLFLVIIAIGFQKYLSGNDIRGYVQTIVAGIVTPSLPHGGWSLTIEFLFLSHTTFPASPHKKMEVFIGFGALDCYFHASPALSRAWSNTVTFLLDDYWPH